MFDSHQLYKTLSKELSPAAAEALATTLGAMYAELRETVTRADFRALTKVVQDLAEAQKELAEAQKELAAAQKQTELRVEELAQAQQNTERAIAELVVTVQALSHRVDNMNKDIGGFSNAFGYTLENAAYRALPALLKKDFGIDIEGKLTRGFLPDKKRRGRDIEVNVLGTASQSGKRLMIIGESKAQISKKKLLSFLEEMVPRLDTGGLPPFIVIVAHMETERGVAALARERGAAFYFNDFD
jgi:hypothetical protein